MKNVQKTVVIGLLIALQVVLTRFLSIQTPIVRIGFQFLAVAITSMMFGPLLGGIAAAVADIVGMIIFPIGGAYFPGFTLTAFLTGALYGIFLYKKPVTWIRVLIANVVIAVFINLILDSYWLTILTGKGFLALLPTRVIKSAVMLPIQVVTIQVVWNRVIGRLAIVKAVQS